MQGRSAKAVDCLTVHQERRDRNEQLLPTVRAEVAEIADVSLKAASPMGGQKVPWLGDKQQNGCPYKGVTGGGGFHGDLTTETR